MHDWTSHAADSFRYLALTLDRKATQTGLHRRIEYTQLGVGVSAAQAAAQQARYLGFEASNVWGRAASMIPHLNVIAKDLP